MKTIDLQLVTVNLENGQRGVFIGIPLVTEENNDPDCQIEEIWFSDVQQVPDHLSVAKLLRLIADQLCRCRASLQ